MVPNGLNDRLRSKTEAADSDELQYRDELDTEWVEEWHKTLNKHETAEVVRREVRPESQVNLVCILARPPQQRNQ